MSTLEIVFFLCGIALTGFSIFIFYCGCRISADIKEDYYTGDDSSSFDLKEQKKVTEILIISYIFLIFGTLAFIVCSMFW